MEFLKNYIKDKNIPFYIGLGFGLLSIIAAIVYGATLNHLTDYFSSVVVALLVVGPLIYIGLSFANLQKIGMFTLAITSFASLLVYIASIYEYPIVKIMDNPDLTKLPEFGAIVAVAALTIIVAIGCNVLCWLKLNATKEVKEEQKEAKINE